MGEAIIAFEAIGRLIAGARACKRGAFDRGGNGTSASLRGELPPFLPVARGVRPGTVRNEFVLPAKALNEAQSFFAAHELALDRPTLLIQPFTSTAVKNWPLDRYRAVARHWCVQGRQVLFSGGPSDRSALEPLRLAGFPVSAGVPLLVSAGLAKLCALTLAADTGMLHLAAAMGKRVVAIIQSTAPGNKYPFQHPDWAVTPSQGVDVATIDTEVVMAACERALAETGLAKLHR